MSIGETKPADILMFVGKQFYPTPQDFISEALGQGVSKRIPLHNPPENIVPGVSRLFFIHPEACVRSTIPDADLVPMMEACTAFSKSLSALAAPPAPKESSDAFLRTWKRDPAFCLHERLEKNPPAEWATILKDLQLEFCPGIFGYCYLTGLQYVCKPGKTQPPEHLRLHNVEAVIVEYDLAEIQGVESEEDAV